MNILDRIIEYKYIEVAKNKSLRPVKMLEKSNFFNEHPLSLKQSLLSEEMTGIIAEFKRKSPSKGIMNSAVLPEVVCYDYFKAGVSAISVLTDTEFFGGSVSDLIQAKKKVGCPVLRKEFIVDEYQIIEARSSGADAVLLIAEVHEAKKIEQLHKFARSLDLEVLVEVHDEKNIVKIPADAEIIGINSRNLGSFSVDIDHLSEMIRKLPTDVVKVAESGIRSVSDYFNLKKSGFRGFLIGEQFMSTADPGESCRMFISEIRNTGR